MEGILRVTRGRTATGPHIWKLLWSAVQPTALCLPLYNPATDGLVFIDLCMLNYLPMGTVAEPLNCRISSASACSTCNTLEHVTKPDISKTVVPIRQAHHQLRRSPSIRCSESASCRAATQTKFWPA